MISRKIIVQCFGVWKETINFLMWPGPERYKIKDAMCNVYENPKSKDKMRQFVNTKFKYVFPQPCKTHDTCVRNTRVRWVNCKYGEETFFLSFRGAVKDSRQNMYVQMSGNSKCWSFCPKKSILRLWAAQNRPPLNQILVTHSTKGFQVWICLSAHTWKT